MFTLFCFLSFRSFIFSKNHNKWNLTIANTILQSLRSPLQLLEKITVKFSTDRIKPWKPVPFTNPSMNWKIQSLSTLLCVNVSVARLTVPAARTPEAYRPQRRLSPADASAPRATPRHRDFWPTAFPIEVGAYPFATDAPLSSSGHGALLVHVARQPNPSCSLHRSKPCFTRCDRENPTHNEITPFVK